MKRVVIISLFFSIISIVMGCKVKNSQNESVVIEFSDKENHNLDLFLDEWIESIELISLESDENILLSNALKLSVFNDEFYISDHQTTNLYRFDRSGRYLNRIGAKGRGPNEYLNILGVTFLGDTVFVSDGMRYGIHVKSFLSNGEYLSTKEFESKTLFFNDMHIHPKGFIIYYPYDLKKENPILELRDREGNPLKTYLYSEFKLINSNVNKALTEDDKGNIYFRDNYRDTIYRIAPNGDFSVERVFDFGDKGFPKEMYTADDFGKAWEMIFDKHPAYLNRYIKSDKITLVNVYYSPISPSCITGVYNSRSKKWLWLTGGVANTSVNTNYRDDILVSIIYPTSFDKFTDIELAKVKNPEVLESLHDQSNPLLALIKFK